MNSASARRDKHLQELIDGNNFKQALTLCEKSIKKGDKSEELLLTKINILLAHPDLTRQQQGRKELNDVLGRAQPISEIEALCALNDIAQTKVDDEPRLETIWERAAGVRPHDENLYIKWFKTKFSERKWKAAQKAAMMYMKKFPSKREPFFWNIITCELAGTHPSSSDIDRKILRPLAYGFLSKASADVVADKPAPSNTRALNSPEELSLLLYVYRSQERYGEALKVLNDPRTGITSRLGGNSWEFVRHRIELYELCHLWNEEWQFCRELLDDAHPDNLQKKSRSSYFQFGEFGDDWKVWIGLLTACAKINSSENAKQTEELIASYIKSKSVSRNARLALLKYYSSGSPEHGTTQEELLSASLEYFSKYRSKVICFKDLQPYVLGLRKPLQERFLRLVAEETKSLNQDKNSVSQNLEWITSEINVLKLNYYLLVSCNDTPAQVSLLRAFVSRCLQLYKVSLSVKVSLPVSDRRPGDDAAMLGAMALIRLHEFAEKHALLQCIAILECLLSHSKHNYDALLTLIRLYMQAGAGTRAADLYSRLSIKNMQHTTVSWILYNRISTIHPCEPSSTISRQIPSHILKNLSNAIDWHLSAEEYNSIAIDRMLECGQYTLLFDTLEIGGWIKNGFEKLMFVVESHRIGRFSQFSQIQDYSSLLGGAPPKTEDTRDVTAFPDNEAAGQQRFVEYLETGPRLNHVWLGSQIRMIELWNFLQMKSGDLEKSSGAEMAETNKSERNSMTEVERESDGIVDMLRSLCAIYYQNSQKLHEPGHAPADSIVSILQDLQKWLFATNQAWQKIHVARKQSSTINIMEMKLLNWEYFHKILVLIDIFRFVLLTIGYVEIENRKHSAALPRPRLDGLVKPIKNSITDLWKSINESASQLRDRLRAHSVPRKMVEVAFLETDDSIGQDLRDIIGREKLEESVSDLCASWVEALEGILRMKMV